MRDIIFKGKRKDNIEWVDGYLFDDGMVDSKRMFIGSLVVTEHKGLGEDVWDIGHDFYEVLPETVGQYTGLTDKNGKKIFEGDIVKTDKFNTPNKFYVIKYDLLLGAFIGEDNGTMYFTTFDGDSELFEIIGNIHDNPEMLEVK